MDQFQAGDFISYLTEKTKTKTFGKIIKVIGNVIKLYVLWPCTRINAKKNAVFFTNELVHTNIIRNISLRDRPRKIKVLYMSEFVLQFYNQEESCFDSDRITESDTYLLR